MNIKTKKSRTASVPVFDTVIVCVCLALTAAILIIAVNFNINPNSKVYAVNALWNNSKSLTTGESLNAESSDKKGYLSVPIPGSVAIGDITVTNDHKDHIIRLVIPGVPGDYFKNHAFSGDLKNIETFRYGYEGSNAVIELVSDAFYEPDINIGSGKLYVGLTDPHEKYDKIVVIDAGHGGEETGSISYGIEEKDVTLKVSKAIEELCEGKNYHVYFTRTADEDVSDEARAALVSDTGADLVISLHTDADPKTRVTHGISGYYCDEGSKDLAGEFVRNIAQAVHTSENGAFLKESGRVIKDGAPNELDLCLGYITNKRDAVTASSDKFAGRAAEAVIQTLDRYFNSVGEF